MRKTIAFLIFLSFLSVVFCGCKNKEQIGDNEKNMIPPTAGYSDGESRIFQSVYSPEVFFAANYFPRANGAAGDGVSDDSSAVQTAIDKAAESGGGVVYLDRGKYRITAPITVKKNVKLIGDFNSPSAKNPVYGDTVVVLSGDFTGKAAFVLEDNAEISDMIIYYENQNIDSPSKFSPVISQNGALKISVKNILMPNASFGIDFSSGTLEDITLCNVYITAFYSAVNIRAGNASVFCENINISPSYLISSPYTNPSNSVRYDDRSDIFIEEADAFTVSAASFSLRTASIDAVRSAFSFTGSGSSISLTDTTVSNVQNAVSANGSFDKGVSFCNCVFSPVFGTGNSSVGFGSSFDSSAVFTGCVFSGKPSVQVEIEGDAGVTFIGCSFSSWKDYGAEIVQGIASFSGCTIVPDSDFAGLADNAVGVFYSNSYFSQLRTSGGQVFSSSMQLSSETTSVDYSLQTPNGAYFLPGRNVIYIVEGNTDKEINAKIDEAHESGGGIVYVREGLYTVYNTINVRENVWLVGAGTGENSLKTVFRADPSFEGTSVVELDKNTSVCSAVIEDSVNLSADGLPSYDRNAVFSSADSIFISDIDIKGFSCGINISDSSFAIVHDVSISSFKVGMKFKNTSSAVISRCEYMRNEDIVLTEYQKQNGIGFYFSDCISSEIFDSSVSSGNRGLYAYCSGNNGSKVSDNSILINNFSSEDVNTSVVLDKIKRADIINSCLSSSENSCDILLDYSGAALFFNTNFDGIKNINGGTAEFTGCIFDETDIPFSVTDGLVRVTASIFENENSSAHLKATGGTVIFEANIIETASLYNGSSTGYIKTSVEDGVSVYDNFNLKRVDYENVD